MKAEKFREEDFKLSVSLPLLLTWALAARSHCGELKGVYTVMIVAKLSSVKCCIASLKSLRVDSLPAGKEPVDFDLPSMTD